jgi:cysteine synthase A
MSTIQALAAPFQWAEPTQIDRAALHRTYPQLAEFESRLGRTRLIELPREGKGARIFAKCEWENPVGSIKDRVAYALICDALSKHGSQTPESLRILEYSGGNLAGALSHLGATLGITMRLVLSSAAPPSLLSKLVKNNARFDLVDKSLGFIAVLEKALAIAKSEPEWTLLYQHRNPSNLAWHRDTTGAEIVRQLKDAKCLPSAWVASVGTGGTLVGVALALSTINPELRTVGVTPSELPYGSELPPNGLPKFAGSGGMGNGIRQPFVDSYSGRIEHYSVSFVESIKAMSACLAVTGIRVGSSGAANWLVAREIASKMSSEAIVVTVFPDAGTPEEWQRVNELG